MTFQVDLESLSMTPSTPNPSYMRPMPRRRFQQDDAHIFCREALGGEYLGFRALCLGFQYFPDSEASEPRFRTLDPVEALSRTTGWGRVAVGHSNYPKPKTLNQESSELGLAEGLGLRAQVHNNQLPL